MEITYHFSQDRLLLWTLLLAANNKKRKEMVLQTRMLAIMSTTSFLQFPKSNSTTCSKHWCLEFNTCQKFVIVNYKGYNNHSQAVRTGNECRDRISWEILEHVDLWVNLWPFPEFGERLIHEEFCHNLMTLIRHKSYKYFQTKERANVVKFPDHL